MTTTRETPTDSRYEGQRVLSEQLRDNMCDGCSRGGLPRHGVCDLFYKAANELEHSTALRERVRVLELGIRNALTGPQDVRPMRRWLETALEYQDAALQEQL